MLNKKLTTIAGLIKKNSSVVDIGTDHAYLPIYLSQNRICKNIIAADISANALKGAEENLNKFNIKNVKLILSDGLKDIKDYYDTIVIAGMGTDSIIKILNGNKLPKNIILSSNNHHYQLRSFMNSINYKLDNEIAIKDGKKFYIIMSYTKGSEKLTTKELKYGKNLDKEYYQYLYEANKKTYNSMNLKNKIKNFKSLQEIKKLAK